MNLPLISWKNPACRCCWRKILAQNKPNVHPKEKFEPHAIHWCCIAHIWQCWKLHSGTNWRKEHHRWTKTHGLWLKHDDIRQHDKINTMLNFLAQFEPDPCCIACTISNNIGKYVMIQTDVENTSTDQTSWI
jgi:hypothetical protein